MTRARDLASNATGSSPTLVDAKGDLLVGTADNTVIRQAIGTNNQVLMADSAQTDGVKWANEATATLTAKGDILSATAANTLSRLAVGANDTVLTADSSTATGLKWAAPSNNANWSLVNAGGTALTGASTITVSGISGADKLMVIVDGASATGASAVIRVQFNSDTGANYNQYGLQIQAASTYAAGNFANFSNGGATSLNLAIMSSNAGSLVSGYMLLNGGNSSGTKIVNGAGGASAATGNGQYNYVFGGWYAGSSTISSVSILTSSGNLDAGTVYVYKSAQEI